MYLSDIRTYLNPFLTKEDKFLYKAVCQIIQRPPRNLSIYHLAFQHRSVAKINKLGIEESNERLEYLGDAVLSLIIGDFLFRLYPKEEEGFH